MKTAFQRILSLLMVLVMLGAMLPAVYADNTPAEEPKDDPIVLTDEDYEIVNDVFARIDAMEDAPAKKNATQTQLADGAAQIVMASENYVEGSLERNGDSFTWWTDEGIRCVYSPRMREIYDNMQAPADPQPAGIYNEPKATKGGWPTGNQVYLIGPYYGSDDSFTDQYKNEARDIAKAIGDTDGYTLYAGEAATIDKVAEAISNGAVVIFDSHGTTDYDGKYVCDDPDGSEVYDYVSQANYSYLCLTSETGMTTADYKAGALYGEAYNEDTKQYELCICVNGAAIANHMKKNSPSGLLWMAICLGMATDTLCEPLRAKGVEVVYGYSQSVSFAGDYRFEETFWDNMIAGKDVASSISAMKAKWGTWDLSNQVCDYYNWTDYAPTISDARRYHVAFPVVVSDEDAHPGQRNDNQQGVWGACSLQTVKSTYTLFSQYNVTAKSNNTAYGTVSVNGSTITAIPANGYFAESAQVISGTATVAQNGNTFSVAAESDCTVQINFAPKTAVTVSFAGATVASQNGYAGDAMTLPKATAPEGYTFVGWTAAPLGSATTEKPDCYTNSFTPTGNTTLYALYSYTEGGGGVTEYVRKDIGEIKSTDTVVITMAKGSTVYALTSANGSNSAPTAVKVSVNDGKLSAEPADALKWNIGGSENAYIFYPAGQTGKWLYCTDTNNGVRVGTESNKTFKITSGYLYNTGTSRYVGVYTTNPDWRCYSSYTGNSNIANQSLAFYVQSEAGTTYYISTLCDHAHTTEVAAEAPTCTTAGREAGVQCVDCNTMISGGAVIDALGHSWSAWSQTAAPGCEAAGEQTRTCGRCGQTQTQPISATGHSYDSGVITTPATCTADGVKTFTCSACGNTKTETVPAIDHNYAGGFCTGCGAAEPVGPVMPKHGDQVVIYAPAYNKALSSQKVSADSFYNKGVDVTETDGVLTGYGDTEIWTVIVNSDGTSSFVYGGQKIGMAASFNSMGFGEVNDKWNIISLGNGLYNIQNTVRGNYMEWFAEKDNWSTYNSKDAATDDRFQLSFYIVSQTEDPEESLPEESLPEESEPTVTATNRYYIAAKRTSGNYFYMTSNLGTSSTNRYQAVDSGKTVLPESVIEPENGYVFVLIENGDGTYYIQAEGIEGDNYLGYNKKNSGTLVSIDSALKVTIEEKNGKYNIHCNISGTERYLALNSTVGQNYFAWYTGEVKDIDLIPIVEETAPVTNGVNGYGMILADDLNMIFNVNLAADSQLVIEFNETDYIYTANQLSACEDGSYDLYFPLAAAQMTDEIVVKFVTGETVVEGGSYTVQGYAQAILQDADKSQYHNIVKAMLNYGYAAQVYFGYKDEPPVVEEMDTETVPETADEMIVEDDSDKISFYGASLVYRDKIAVRFYFTGNAEGMLFETDKGDTYTAELVNGLWCVEIDNIMPYELDQQILLSTDDMDVLYGPMNYIVRMNQKGDAKLQNLMQALYHYYRTAFDLVTA